MSEIRKRYAQYQMRRGGLTSGLRLRGRRRRYGKRRAKNGAYVRQQNRPAKFNTIGFPKRLQCKMKFVDSLKVLTTTSGVSQYQLWSINSIFTPRYGATTHQPLYHDQYAFIYQRYLVLGAAVKVTLVNETDVYPFRALLVGLPAVGGSANINVAHEQLRRESGGQCKIGGANNEPLVLYNYFYPWATRGIRKEQYIDNQAVFGAPFGSDPTNEMLCQVWVQPVDEVSTIAVSVKYEVLFYCELSYPNQIGES